MPDLTETQAVSELTNEAAALKVASLDKFSAERPFALVPDNCRVENMREYAAYIDKRQPAPRTVEKRMRFVDVTSFLTYFQAFRVGYKPQLFHKVANDGMHIVGVFDYDWPGTPVEGHPNGGNPTAPSWGNNVAFLKMAYSRDYQALRNGDGQWFSQTDFALFVEENQHLFFNPDGATMFELAQHLKGKQSVEWESGKRLNNSSTQFQYLETVDAQTVRGTPITVPDYLLLRLPMYEGMSEQEIKMAFRWRIVDGEIKFAYKLLTKVAERKAEEEVKQRISGTTQLDLLTVSTFNGLTPHNLD